MMRHLREIMNISWKDKISNKVILEKTGPPPMADILIQINLRWLGYVDRMDFTRIPRQLFYSQLRDGKRFKDIVKKKKNLKRKIILVNSWKQRAKDRTTWRNLIKA